MIVPMKKAKLIFMEESKDDVLLTLQTYGLLMPDSKHQKQASVSTELVDTLKAIEVIEKYLKKKSFGSNEEVSVETFLKINKASKKLVKEVLEQHYKFVSLTSEKETLEKNHQSIMPYQKLGVTTKQLKQLSYLSGVIGKIDKKLSQGFIGSIQSLELHYDLVNEDDLYSYFTIVVLNEDKEKLNQLLSEHKFIVDKLDSFEDLNDKVLIQFEEKISQVNADLLSIENYFIEKANNLAELKLLYDQLLAKELRTGVEFLSTENTIYIEGWMREDHVQELEKLLNEQKIDFELELRDPIESELPPTALKNNAFVKPFESITNQFSIPNPREIDPNPIMSLWYWLIFGIMVGDMGYGLLMIVLFGLALKFLKLKGGIKELAKIFVFTGFTGMLAGGLFGSILGFDAPWPKVLDPINDPIPMLIVSIAIGMIHILTALVLKLMMALRNKDILGALSDSVSWILILSGVSIFATTLAGIFTPEINQILTYVTLGFVGLGALLIILFNGREKETFLGKAVSAFTGLYNASAYLSDILSYSRILALALSSGVIAYTFNLLGGMVWDSIPYIGFIFGLIVYIIGHIFNFVMGLLSAYVHAGRLQYLEFYGKFFEGGGYLYEPLQLQLKYVYKVNLKKENK